MEYSSKVSQMLGEVVLDAKKINKRRLSLELGLSPSHVWKIFKGQRNLTADVALRLEDYSGVPAYDWLKLQAEDELNAELLKVNKEPLNLSLPSSFEKRVQSREASIDVDDVLALKVGQIKVSHETSNNVVVAFDGNDETHLGIHNNYEPCWIEKTFSEPGGAVIKKIICHFNAENKAYRPNDIKFEGKSSDRYENLLLEDVTGAGELQNNGVYIKVLDASAIECFLKVPKSYQTYRLTMIGAESQCLITEFKGYEER